MKSKMKQILEDLIIHKKKGVTTAKTNNVTEGYISIIKNKIKLLKYRPLIIDNEIYCLECKRPNDTLTFHYHYKSKQPIAIICNNCKKILGNKIEFETGKLTNTYYEETLTPFNINENDIVGITITIDNANELINFKQSPAESYNDIITKLIKIGRWFKQEKNAYKRIQGPNINL